METAFSTNSGAVGAPLHQPTLAELIYQHATRPIPPELRTPAPPEAQHPQHNNRHHHHSPNLPPRRPSSAASPFSDPTSSVGHGSRQQHSSWRDVSDVMSAMERDPHTSATVGHFLLTRGEGGASAGGGGGANGSSGPQTSMMMARRQSMSSRMLLRTGSEQSLLAGGGGGGAARARAGSFRGAAIPLSGAAGGDPSAPNTAGSFRRGSFIGGRCRFGSMAPAAQYGPRPPSVRHLRQVPPLYAQHPRNDGWAFSDGIGWDFAESRRGGGGGDRGDKGADAGGGLAQTLTMQERQFHFSFAGGGASAGGRNSPTPQSPIAGAPATSSATANTFTITSGGGPTATLLSLAVPAPPPSALVSRGPLVPAPPPPMPRTLMARAEATEEDVVGEKDGHHRSSARKRPLSPRRGGGADSSSGKGLLASQLKSAAAAAARAELSNTATADISTVDGRHVVRLDVPFAEYAAARRRGATDVPPPALVAHSRANDEDGYGDHFPTTPPPEEIGALTYAPWFGPVWDAVDAAGRGGGDAAGGASEGTNHGGTFSNTYSGIGGGDGSGGFLNGSIGNLSVTFNSAVFKHRAALASSATTDALPSLLSGLGAFASSGHGYAHSLNGPAHRQRRLQRYAADVKGTSLDPNYATLTPAEMRHREGRQRLAGARRSRRKMAALGPNAVAGHYKAAHNERMRAAEEAAAAEARAYNARQSGQRGVGAGGAEKDASPSPARNGGGAAATNAGGTNKVATLGQALGGASNGSSTTAAANSATSIALGGPNDPADLAHTLRQLRGVPPTSLADADPSDFVSYYRRRRVDGRQSALVASAMLLADEQRQRREAQQYLFDNLQSEQRLFLRREEARRATAAERAAAAATATPSTDGTATAAVDGGTISKAKRKGASLRGAPSSYVSQKMSQAGPQRVVFDLIGVAAALSAHQKATCGNGAAILASATAATSGAGGGGGGGEGVMSRAEAMKTLEGRNYLFDGPTVFAGGQAPDQHTVAAGAYGAFADREIGRLMALSTVTALGAGGDRGGLSSSSPPRGGFSSHRRTAGGGGGGLLPADMPAYFVESEILMSDTTPGLNGLERTLCPQLQHYKYRMLLGGRRYATLAFESGAAAAEAERQMDRDALAEAEEGARRMLLKRRKQQRRRNRHPNGSFSSSNSADGAEGSSAGGDGNDDDDADLLLADGAEALARGGHGRVGSLYNMFSALALSSEEDSDFSDVSNDSGESEILVDGEDEEAAFHRRAEQRDLEARIAGVSVTATTELFGRMRGQQGSFDSLLDELVMSDEEGEAHGEEEEKVRKSSSPADELLSVNTTDEEASSRQSRPSSGSGGIPPLRAGSPPLYPDAGNGSVSPPKGKKKHETKPQQIRLLSLDSAVRDRHISGWVASLAQAAAAPLTAPPGAPRKPRGTASFGAAAASVGPAVAGIVPAPYGNHLAVSALCSPSYASMTRAQQRHMRTETAPFSRLTDGMAARLALRSFEELHYPQYAVPCLGAGALVAPPTVGGVGSGASSPSSPYAAQSGGRGRSGAGSAMAMAAPFRRAALPYPLAPPSLAALATGESALQQTVYGCSENNTAEGGGPLMLPDVACVNVTGGNSNNTSNTNSPTRYSQQQRRLDAMLRTYDQYSSQFLFPHSRPAPSEAEVEELFNWEGRALLRAAAAAEAEARQQQRGRKKDGKEGTISSTSVAAPTPQQQQQGGRKGVSFGLPTIAITADGEHTTSFSSSSLLRSASSPSPTSTTSLPSHMQHTTTTYPKHTSAQRPIAMPHAALANYEDLPPTTIADIFASYQRYSDLLVETPYAAIAVGAPRPPPFLRVLDPMNHLQSRRRGRRADGEDIGGSESPSYATNKRSPRSSPWRQSPTKTQRGRGGEGIADRYAVETSADSGAAAAGSAPTTLAPLGCYVYVKSTPNADITTGRKKKTALDNNRRLPFAAIAQRREVCRSYLRSYRLWVHYRLQHSLGDAVRNAIAEAAVPSLLRASGGPSSASAAAHAEGVGTPSRRSRRPSLNGAPVVPHFSAIPLALGRNASGPSSPSRGASSAAGGVPHRSPLLSALDVSAASAASNRSSDGDGSSSAQRRLSGGANVSSFYGAAEADPLAEEEVACDILNPAADSAVTAAHLEVLRSRREALFAKLEAPPRLYWDPSTAAEAAAVAIREESSGAVSRTNTASPHSHQRRPRSPQSPNPPRSLLSALSADSHHSGSPNAAAGGLRSPRERSTAASDAGSGGRTPPRRPTAAAALRSPRTRHVGHITPFVVEPFSGTFAFLGREAPRAWVDGSGGRASWLAGADAKDRNEAGGAAVNALALPFPSSVSTTAVSPATSANVSFTEAEGSQPQTRLHLDSHHQRRQSHRPLSPTSAALPRGGSNERQYISSGNSRSRHAHSTYPNLTLASLAELLTPNLFTAEEMLLHMHAEVRAAEAEGEAAAIPPSLSHLAFLPVANEGVGTFGGYAPTGEPLVFVPPPAGKGDMMSDPTTAGEEQSTSPRSQQQVSPRQLDPAALASSSPSAILSNAVVGSRLVMISPFAAGQPISQQQQPPALAPIEGLGSSPYAACTSPLGFAGPAGALARLLASAGSGSVLVSPMTASSAVASEKGGGLGLSSVLPTVAAKAAMVAASVSSLNGALLANRWIAAAAALNALSNGRNHHYLSSTSAARRPCTYLPSPLHGANGLPAADNYAFRAQLAPLSAQGQRQFGRLLIMLHAASEAHRQRAQLTTCPATVISGIAVERPPSAKNRRSNNNKNGHAAIANTSHLNHIGALQTLQQLTATTGQGALLPNPWSQHTAGPRHASHWGGARSHHFRMGRPSATVGSQTALNGDKDYRAMRVTLVSYLSSAAEPIARQRLLHDERSAMAAMLLAHRLKRRLCEAAAFRISTISAHRSLIRGALAEQSQELALLRQHKMHRSDGGATPPSASAGCSPSQTHLFMMGGSAAAGGELYSSPFGGVGGSNEAQHSSSGSPNDGALLLRRLLGDGDPYCVSVDVPPPDLPTLAATILACSAVGSFARPSVAAKTDLTAHAVVSERSAREAIEALCVAAYERLALQRHIALQGVLASMDVAETAFQLARETAELRALRRAKRRQESMLALFDEGDN